MSKKNSNIALLHVKVIGDNISDQRIKELATLLDTLPHGYCSIVTAGDIDIKKMSRAEIEDLKRLLNMV